MPDSFRQMILCPETPEFTMLSTDLIEILNQVGLIGASIHSGLDNGVEGVAGQRFYVGQHFLQHISFMGCAPAIEFALPDNTDHSDLSRAWDQFTFIYLPEPPVEPVWRADLDMAKPACPECKKRIPRSAEYIDRAAGSLSCPHCGRHASVCEYNWREFGGCARTMISIVNVYPKEAIPSGNLLNQLTKLTGVTWRYFYINESLSFK